MSLMREANAGVALTKIDMLISKMLYIKGKLKSILDGNYTHIAMYNMLSFQVTSFVRQTITR